MDQVEPDGRRARRERGRTAVIDALYSLLQEGVVPVTTDAIVERSGVSLSSIFRYFESIDELQQQTITSHFQRFAHLFEIPAIGIGSPADRIQRYVDARLDLYTAIAPIGRLARARSIEQPMIRASLQQTRVRFSQQATTHFATELATRTPAEAEDLVDLVDSLTSFEAWDLLTVGHDRTRPQIRRAWNTGVSALLAVAISGSQPL